MFDRLHNLLLIFLIVIMPMPVLACAVCYTDNGMSGASIALIVIISSFIIIFFTYRTLKKILNKD